MLEWKVRRLQRLATSTGGAFSRHYDELVSRNPAGRAGPPGGSGSAGAERLTWVPVFDNDVEVNTGPGPFAALGCGFFGCGGVGCGGVGCGGVATPDGVTVRG